MKKIFTFFLLIAALTAYAETKFYLADDETNFSNPERGFYTASEQDIDKTTTTSNLSDGDFNATSGRSLVYRQYVFSGFREDSLTQTVLDLIDADFATYRRNGFKCVLRFSYTVDETQVGGKYQDGSPEIWEMHLKQLKPVMAKNMDVIALVQAGFLGVWGEWYYSSTGTGDAIPQTVRTNLINQMLAAVPVGRTVGLRTPKYKTKYIGDSDPLTEAEAFSGSARARLCHFNDAFLYEAKNMGTYTNRKKDMAYLAQECLYLPNGGESDVYTQSVYDQWATGSHAISDMSELHYSYLNQDFSQLVISNWKKEGKFIEIAKHMGYRFCLVEATIPGVVRPSDALSVKMKIKNIGYATPYNERHAYIVLLQEGVTKYVLPLESDPRFWAPNSAETIIDEQLTLPAGITEGEYDLALYMPDACESIAADPRYAIRMANYDMWDEKTGYNMLGIEVNVSATEPQPEPTPDPEPQTGVDQIGDITGRGGYEEAYLYWKNPGEMAKMDTIYIDLSQGTDTAYNGELGASSATVTYADGVSSVTYETQATWLWAGAKYPVDKLTGFTSFTFEIKGDGSNITVYPYAHDGTWRWIEDAYSVALSNKKWVQHTITPSAPLWGDATYKFGDKPIIDFGFIANPATKAKGSFEIRNLMLLKQHEYEDNYGGVRIVRKQGSNPTSLSDGETIYFGKSDRCVDTGLEHGVTYHYAFYSFNTEGEMSFPQFFSVKIDGTGIAEIQEASAAASGKVMLNGQLYILKNGVLYNAMGQVVE